MFPADLKELYLGPETSSGWFADLHNPLTDFKPVQHASKGGVRLSPHITYGCLAEDSGLDANLWLCPECEEEMYNGTLERLQHMRDCTFAEQESQSADQQAGGRQEERGEENPLARAWSCSVCQETFKFTSGQIMKHKKSCGK